jgi:hypothetical protein
MYNARKYPAVSLMPPRSQGPEQHIASAVPITSNNANCSPVASGMASKQRLRWTPELHQRFVDAVTELGGPDSGYLQPFVIMAALCFASRCL